MKLAADENIDSAIVAWLRAGGHDVFWAAERTPACSDDALLAQARQEARILLTADLDFGEMVFRQRLLSTGIVLIRVRAASQKERLRIFQAHWPGIERRLQGGFVVVGNRKTRVRPLPTGGPREP